MNKIEENVLGVDFLDGVFRYLFIYLLLIICYILEEGLSSVSGRNKRKGIKGFQRLRRYVNGYSVINIIKLIVEELL